MRGLVLTLLFPPPPCPPPVSSSSSSSSSSEEDRVGRLPRARFFTGCLAAAVLRLALAAAAVSESEPARSTTSRSVSESAAAADVLLVRRGRWRLTGDVLVDGRRTGTRERLGTGPVLLPLPPPPPPDDELLLPPLPPPPPTDDELELELRRGCSMVLSKSWTYSSRLASKCSPIVSNATVLALPDAALSLSRCRR